MIGSSLLRYRDNQRYLLIDTETEGLNLHSSRPWEIAYAICTNKTIESISVRYPAWPDINVSAEAARITRFDQNDYYSRAEDPEVVMKDFESLLLDPQYLILGHNVLGFDIYPIQTWRRLCGRPTDWSYAQRVIDTLCLSRAYRHMIQPDLNAFTVWQYKMLNFRDKLKKPKSSDADKPMTPQEAHAFAQKGTGCSLGAMAKEFDIEYDERQAHGAQYDCHINHAVWQRLQWSLEV